jgi:HD superfamily phosphohydrolase/tRNA A-37 threonylcarbamoyl transferase component Bud32
MLNEEFLGKLAKCYPDTKEGMEARGFELPTATQALDAIQKNIAPIYEMTEPIDIGGASIVVKVRHTKTGIDKALKLPRPRGQRILDSVKQEMHHLVRIHHENIITVHYMDEVPVGDNSYPFFIMDYIPNAINLRKRLEQMLAGTQRSSDLHKATEWLAGKLLLISGAISFLHEAKIIHFDVKPSNIFIDTSLGDRPVLADLGYAKTFSESSEPVVVGFTLFYAHPDLAEHYLSASSSNRVNKPESPKNFKFMWDVYAFGKTILELLALVDSRFPDTVGYDNTFSFLHLAACRMLDGGNMSEDEIKRLKMVETVSRLRHYWQHWQKLTRREFDDPEIRYSSMKQVARDLAKFDGGFTLVNDLPELNPYLPHTVHISDHGPAPFTPRVKMIVEHPVFQRLCQVPQLGLTRLIYPSATHTRLEHSIGTFRNACQYVLALWNDPYNPLFRQLADARDLKVVLLCGLLHDLGYFPFAHELEEVSTDFKHDQISLALLDSQTTDGANTLKQIIENPDWGWGVPVEAIKEVLRPPKPQPQLIPDKSFKTRLLSSIINGPIDVDKTDYLIRDSDECRLPYGGLIDYERLVRTLTVIVATDTQGHGDPQLGVYEKGQSAAESLTFARYLLYQALYWHHSARAIRAMIRQAATAALGKSRGSGKSRRSFREDLFKLIGVGADCQSTSPDQVLDLIAEWTDESGKEIIGLLRQRRFYKRVLTIHYERLPGETAESTWEKLRRVDRNTLQRSLRDAIIEEYAKFVAAGDFSRTSLLAQERTDATMATLQKDNSILVDIPNPSYGAEDSLKVIPEPERLQKNYETRIKTGERISEVWGQVHYGLMRIAAKSRVYCHPDARDTLMAALKPENIKTLLDGLIGANIKG